MPNSAKPQITDISLLRAFLQTTKSGNTRVAAKALGISQPAVSGAIRRLETLVGQELFDRNSRPMRITNVGRALVKRIEPILKNLDNLPIEIEALVKHCEMDLRIGFSDSIGICVSPILLPRIVPLVKNLAAYCENTPKIVNKLISDKIDIAIATKYPSERPEVSAQLLFTENYVVVTPKKYEGLIHTVSDLSILPDSLPVVRFNDESLDSVQIERVLRQLDYHGTRMIAVDSNASALGLVSSGQGWTVMPPLGVWAAQLQTKDVAVHRIESLQSVRTFWIMYEDKVYSRLADTIAKESLKLLKDVVLPDMAKYSTLLANSVHLLGETTESLTVL